MGKPFLITFGGVAVALGTIGLFLPLLPTTPFLLLAAACFSRSSDRHYEWLLSHRWFGPYLRQYREHRTIPMRAKVVTLVILWGTIGPTAILFADSLIVQTILLVVGLSVSVYILSHES